MTEDQKYQGHLYRDKASKAAKRKSVSILEPSDQNALVARKAYVEDDPDSDVPPHVPTPPPAVAASSTDSVFDYLVDENVQNTPKITFAEKREEEMSMKNDAPSVFSRPTSRNEYRNNEEQADDDDYIEHGFSYGAEPVNPRPLDMNGSTLTLDFMTPAAKVTKARLDNKHIPGSVSHSRNNSGAGSEKKRKRGQADEQSSNDSHMADAPTTIKRSVVDTPAVVHTGLTGGLSRMMSRDDDFPFARSPSSEPERDRDHDRPGRQASKHEDPASPIKRTRRSGDDSNGLGISIKGRAGKVLSMVGGSLANGSGQTTITDGALVRTRRRTSSSDNAPKNKDGEKRERKKHKVTRHNGTASANVRIEHKSKRQASDESLDSRRKLKAIEYHKDYSNSDSDEERQEGAGQQMVVFGAEEKMISRCDTFLSYVNKGPRSERGYSINKVLKRWHRDNDVHGPSKFDEEKELWRGLRLKKNDRGEIVIFF